VEEYIRNELPATDTLIPDSPSFNKEERDPRQYLIEAVGTVEHINPRLRFLPGASTTR